MIKASNPIMKCDYPDPDVIRVDGAYYMVSTTMHFMPGCPILRSYDLANWEVVSYVYDTLEDDPAHRLEGEKNIYGCGMWAASLRYHNGTYYVCFAANDTHKTYLFTTDDIEGKWKRREIEGFYHDCSLLFDDDERVYIVYGNSEIHLTELRPDLSGPLEGGLDRIILRDEKDISLGFEGCHLYKLWGKYYLFTIHAPQKDKFMRTEACFIADSLSGEFRGGDILCDDLDFFGNGAAQGGIIDTPDGEWYMMMFQDRGSAGRMPVLIPMRWENGLPAVDGRIPKELYLRSSKPGHRYEPLWGSDDFDQKPGDKLKSFWQWNHSPHSGLWQMHGGRLEITTDKLCTNLCQARNTLTQRASYPTCRTEVTVDASELNEGDIAGIAALQSNYAAAAVTKRDGKCFLVMLGRRLPESENAHMYYPGIRSDTEPPAEYECIALDGDTVRIGMELDFTDLRDTAEFYCCINGEKRYIGIKHRLYFWLDHFTGCRPSLFVYSTIKTGGTAVFTNFDHIS